MKAVFREPGAGERIPSTGATHTIVLPGESTGGVFAADVIDMPPGWAAVAAHTHLLLAEVFDAAGGKPSIQALAEVFGRFDTVL
jgi:hypothetical protein